MNTSRRSRHRLIWVAGLAAVVLLLVAACLPLRRPALLPTETRVIQCTAPACPNGRLECGQASGCPGGCGTVCRAFTPTPCSLGCELPVTPGTSPLAVTPITPIIQCTAPVCDQGLLICGNPLGCPGGCGTICATPTPCLLGCGTEVGPRPVCTPPACGQGEVFACGDPNGCPGGCGTICATPSPTVPPGQVCALATQTPPPSAPTVVVNGTPDPSRQVNPHVVICADRQRLRVGERVTVAALAADIGLPDYTVHLRNASEGHADFVPAVEVTWAGQMTLLGTERNLLYPIDWHRGEDRISVDFEALAPGTVEIRVSALGEVHYGYPGPAMWQGGGSDVIAVTIEP